MNILSLEEFINYYHKYNNLPFNIYINKNKKLSDKELENKYNKYLSIIQNNKQKQNEYIEKQKKKQFYIIENRLYIDEKWEECKKLVFLRDNNKCRLLTTLQYNNISLNKELLTLLRVKEYSQLDVAHIFPKSSYPKLRYNIDNLILLSRIFHSRLDNYQDPLSGKNITKEDQIWWWKFIIGDDLYNKLEILTKNM